MHVANSASSPESSRFAGFHECSMVVPYLLPWPYLTPTVTIIIIISSHASTVMLLLFVLLPFYYIRCCCYFCGNTPLYFCYYCQYCYYLVSLHVSFPSHGHHMTSIALLREIPEVHYLFFPGESFVCDFQMKRSKDRINCTDWKAPWGIYWFLYWDI